VKYNSSTKYGAGLNEARKATFMLGLARAPMLWAALRASRPRALSKEAGVHMAQECLPSCLARR
jgi:hypothetical protein